MKKLVIAGLAACGLMAACADDIGVTYADGDPVNGDITVAPGGEVTIGPNGLSTNNTQNLTVTFEDGGTIKAIPTDKDGNTVTTYHRLWRDYFINGTVTYDGSDLHSSIAPEFRRSMIATNGTLVISADRTAIYWGSADSSRTRNYPLYDVSNVVFAAGRGTIYLSGEATLRDDPSAVFENVTFYPSRARLAIAGQGIVSNRTVWSTKRVNFDAYGSEVVLLDESYIPEGVTPVINGNRIFRIRPSDIVVSNETFDSGNNVARVFWRSKEGSGVVPFDIHLGGGTVELQTTRSTYEFAGKIYGSGTIDLQGPNPRTINEIEGAFNFKNSTSSDSTITIRKVNPGSRLRCSGGTVKLVFEEGALPANATRATYGLDTYVFVPAADGSLDTANLAGQLATTAYVPFGGDATMTASDCHAKIGVTNNATFSLVLDGTNVPTVVGGEGTFAVDMVDWREVVGLWLDASQPYDTSTKGAPYYAPPGVNHAGHDYGNIFFTNSYPLVETWYDVRGTERTWRLYNGRFYQGNQFQLFTHVYPYLAQGNFAGQTMSYITFGVNGVSKSTWSKDGPDTPSVTSNMGGNRRLYVEGQTLAPTAVIMVFGSQLGGGMAMLGGGSFARNGRTLEDAICKTAPAGTTIWVDGEEVDPTTAHFNGGWQIVSVVGTAAATVSKIGENTAYQDAGGQNYAEILFFTNTVTDVQRQQVEAYLAEKWGISTYQSGSKAALPLRAEGRTGSVVVGAEASVELRGTYAGNLTVDGYLAISEPQPWTAADVPTAGLVDWYDGDDTNSLGLTTYAGADNAVSYQYPRGKTKSTLTSGCYLWGTGNRQPFAVKAARGLGAERTWIDYNHPDGYPMTTSDGNVSRFIPYDKSGAAGNAVAQTFRTVLVALDSCKGGGTVLASHVGGSSGDFRRRNPEVLTTAIWPNECSANVKNGVTRLNGAVVNRNDGLTGAPEVLTLTAAGDVSAMCVDTYYSTESSGGASGTAKAQGIIHGEMLMYDSVLEDDVLANLEAYLMGKWTGVLPAGWSDLREATVTAGTGTVSAVAAKLPKFGDDFLGTVAVPDAAFAFTFDGAAGAVTDAIVARGATIDLPAAVAVTVDCTNMQGAQATSVPLFDVAGFANPVAWTFTATNAGNKRLLLHEENGKLMLDLLDAGTMIIFR